MTIVPSSVFCAVVAFPIDSECFDLKGLHIHASLTSQAKRDYEHVDVVEVVYKVVREARSTVADLC